MTVPREELERQLREANQAARTWRTLAEANDARIGKVDLKSIWEQACGGLFTEHGDCPATFACSAILCELVSAGYCGGCFCEEHRCKAYWKDQKKCCPDCTHT